MDLNATGQLFEQAAGEQPAVRGFLHRPASRLGDGLVLTHGAGGDCAAPGLVAIAGALTEADLTVLRCDLPYRQARAKGPPHPAGAPRDREGLRGAVLALRRMVPGRMFLGGQSYGGRQASLLVAEEPELVGALLLLSYPLHPPGRARELRTAHFPRLRTPALFVHGSADPFGSLEELESARRLIPARTSLVAIGQAGHGLGRGRASPTDETVQRIVEAFLTFVV